MRHTLSAPPFDAAKLSANFGFPVPPPFVTLLNALCADCGSAKAACERLEDVLGWVPAGDDMRYDGTPPELFPIAGTGVDGGHFGYVIHAPELPACDHSDRAVRADGQRRGPAGRRDDVQGGRDSAVLWNPVRSGIRPVSIAVFISMVARGRREAPQP